MKMLSIVLVSALVAQSTLGAPNNCGELCNKEQTTGSSSSWGSRSGYSSYSRYGSGHQIAANSGLGATGSRLETLDENVIGGSGFDRPGTWEDQKHYVTDDGKGEMSYKAGQQVSDNSYKKWASHSYRYGTHDKHQAQANSQILSSSEFQQELQNVRNRIDSFMNSFRLQSGSMVNSQYLEDFKSKASLIASQMNSVCNQVDQSSLMYQQMKQLMESFERQVQQRQQQIESFVFQSNAEVKQQESVTYGSSYHSSPRPQPVEAYVRPAPVVVTPSPLEINLVNDVSSVQSEMMSIFSAFSSVRADAQFQQDFNAQIDSVNRKLIDLTYRSVQNEALRSQISQMKSQFESWSEQIRTRIQEMKRLQAEEEARIRNHELQIQREKQIYEQRKEELDRIQREQQQKLTQERQWLQEEEMKIKTSEQEYQRQLAQIQQQKLQQQQQVIRAPQLAPISTISVQSSFSGESKYTTSASASAASTGSASYVRPQQQQQQVQQVQSPHIDLTAQFNRMQQELHRLQNEISSFNMYTMRLTEANSQSVVSEANRQAEELRRRINNLCDSSSKYQNQQVLSGAEEVKRRFESMVNAFQQQAARYSAHSEFSASGSWESESSWGASGNYQSHQQPSLTNVDVEHSQLTELEVGRRGSAGAAGASQRIECVEQQAGQPCISQIRYKRDAAGGK